VAVGGVACTHGLVWAAGYGWVNGVLRATAMGDMGQRLGNSGLASAGSEKVLS